MDYVLHCVDEACAFATLGPTFIAVWRGEPTRARLEIAMATLEEHVTATGTPVFVLAVVEEGSPPPSPEDMARLEGWLADLPRLMAAVVGVLETRSARPPVHDAAEVVGAIMAPSVPAKSCFDTEEACSWLTLRMKSRKDAPSRLELESAIAAIRALIPSRIAAPAAR